jgi:hypothetical protein
MQSVHITTKVVSSNPAHGKVYLMWFSPGTLVSSTNKTDRHDIAEILLKVAFDNITPLSYFYCIYM